MKRVSIAEQTIKNQLQKIDAKVKQLYEQINSIKTEIGTCREISEQLEAEQDRLRQARIKASEQRTSK